MSEEVTIRYPDFKKYFDLTIDTEGHPITIISRTLRDKDTDITRCSECENREHSPWRADSSCIHLAQPD